MPEMTFVEWGIASFVVSSVVSLTWETWRGSRRRAAALKDEGRRP